MATFPIRVAPFQRPEFLVVRRAGGHFEQTPSAKTQFRSAFRFVSLGSEFRVHAAFGPSEGGTPNFKFNRHLLSNAYSTNKTNWKVAVIGGIIAARGKNSKSHSAD